MSKRPLEGDNQKRPSKSRKGDSCCVRPSHKQWINKNLTHPMSWSKYVDSFLRDYEELDASSIEDKREFLKKYFIFGEDKDNRLNQLGANPYDGEGMHILNDWMQCCQHRALTCPANEESKEATDRFIAWLQGEGQTGDKLQVCMHLTNKLGENLQEQRKRLRVKGGRRLSRRKQSRRKQSRRRQSRRRQSRRRRSSKRNRLTRSRR